jgi:hypothetical protein
MHGARPYRSRLARKQIYHDPTLVEMLSLTDWWHFVAETIALVALLIALNVTVFKGNIPAGGMPHPYWIPVLLMSSQYGMLGGLFASVVATTAYFVVDAPPQSAALDFYSYAGTVAGQPAAWLATALILGGLRSLHIRHSRDLTGQLEEVTAVVDDLSEGLESALAEIRNLERSIAVDTSSVAAVLRSLARLDTTHRRAAAASFADLIRHGVGASSFAIYLREQDGFEAAHAVDSGRTLPVSALPPLEGPLVDALSRTDGILDGMQDCPVTGERVAVIAALLRHGSDGRAVGAIVCQISDMTQGMAVARRRLEDLARALGVVLSSCEDADCGAYVHD